MVAFDFSINKVALLFIAEVQGKVGNNIIITMMSYIAVCQQKLLMTFHPILTTNYILSLHSSLSIKQ